MIEIEKSKLNLQKQIDQLQYLNELDEDQLSYYSVVESIFGIFNEILVLEKSNISKTDILDCLTIPRMIFRKSNFFDRMQSWYRGYQGDFEMIEYIMGNTNKAQKGSIAYYIERYGLNCPASQQHRNKVNEQANRILALATQNKNKSNRIRILSIACGSSPDIRMVQQYLDPEKTEIVLLDSDSEALEYSLKKLSKLKKNIQIINGNIFRHLIQLKDYGEFDLVIIGGLFDYLKDHLVIKILKNIRENNLKPGGKLFFTNISHENIDRIFMEYLANWNLISRNVEDLKSMCQEAGFIDENVKMSMENSKTTFLVDITNKKYT